MADIHLGFTKRTFTWNAIARWQSSHKTSAATKFINHFTDDPQIPALDFTFNQAKRREVNFAISNAFGFGGHNVCLAFRKY